MSEWGVDAKAFNTCKGIVIIIGEAEEGGVSFGLYNMHGSSVSRIQTYPEIYTHACLLVSNPFSYTHKTTLLDKPTVLVQ